MNNAIKIATAPIVHYDPENVTLLERLALKFRCDTCVFAKLG